MLERLRTPFLIAAAIAIVLALGVELGTQLLPPPPVDPAGVNQALPPGLQLSGDTLATARGEQPPRQGWGIPALAIIDVLIVMRVALFIAALIMGVAEAVAAVTMTSYISPIVFYLILFLTLILRPEGLMGTRIREG